MKKDIVLIVTDKYKKWTKEDQIILKKDFSVAGTDELITTYINSFFKQ